MGTQPEEVTPEQIRERMADTRAALAANLDRLKDRTNPRNLLSRQLAGARRKLPGGGSDGRKGRRREVTAGSSDTGRRVALDRGSTPLSDDAGRGTDGGTNPARAVAGTVRRQMQQRPMLAGLAAVLLGAATAVLLPGPRRR